MSFGLTENGFVLKRLEDIKIDLENDFKELFGEIDINPDAPFGQIIGVMSRHLAEIWEQSQNVYLSQYPASANGMSLDGTSQLTGIIRLASTSSEAVCQLDGSNGTLVPDGNKASQSVAGNIFSQVGNVQIDPTNLHKCTVLIEDDTDKTYQVTISGTTAQYAAVGKTKAEIAENLKTAVNNEVALQDLVLATYNIGDEIFTITILNAIDPVTLSQIPLTVSRIFFAVPGTDVSILDLWSPGLYRADDTGSLTVPAASLNTIENPVAGLNTIINFEDGIAGRDPETDVELRTRRAESLQILGAATLGAIQSRILQEVDNVTQVRVIENRTDEWIPPGSSPTGRPPHSFEAIVQGGDDTEIAEKIWEVKAAGIETDGNTSVVIVDSNGDNQTIEFTRPTPVYTFVRVDFDTTGSESSFPGDGVATMRQNIYDLGILHDIGEDVLYQRFFGSVYAVPGVVDATIYLATSANPADPAPSWAIANLIIDSDEFAEFINNATRIVINNIT